MLGENLLSWCLNRSHLRDAELTRTHSDYIARWHHPHFISRESRRWEVSSGFLDKGETKAKLKKKVVSLLCDLKMTACFLIHDFFFFLFVCVHLIELCHFFQVEFNQNSVVFVIGIHVSWAEQEDDPRFLSSFASVPCLAKCILSLLCLRKKFQKGVSSSLAVVRQDLLLLPGSHIYNQRSHLCRRCFWIQRWDFCSSLRFSSEECAGELFFAISGTGK